LVGANFAAATYSVESSVLAERFSYSFAQPNVYDTGSIFPFTKIPAMSAPPKSSPAYASLWPWSPTVKSREVLGSLNQR
jgi:hypothetical protein